jgi:hypothetical protein
MILKTNIMKSTLLVLSMSLLIGFVSCIHREFDEPPIKEIPEGNIMTVEELRQVYNDSAMMLGQAYYKFEKELSVFATVTMDDKSGNIYKSAYIQDQTGAINLRLSTSGGIYEGDSVRLYLKGTVISSYQGMLQLDSVDVDKNIIKQATQKNLEPELVTIGQIKAGAYQGKLIKLEDVQFVDSDLGNTYANPITLQTINRYIENCQEEQLIVRTSGYANFAGDTLPNGRGSLIAIVGQFGNDWQLYIRGTEEVDFNKGRCGEFDEIFSEDFSGLVNNEEFSLTGWKNINQTGDVMWKGFVSPTLSAATITGDGNANITWLITPKITIGTDSKISFDSRAANIVGAELEILISTDYNGGNAPQDAMWTSLPATIATSSSGFSNWIPSGSLSLSSYSGDVYFAFKYTTANSQTGQYFIDNLNVFND